MTIHTPLLPRLLRGVRSLLPIAGPQLGTTTLGATIGNVTLLLLTDRSYTTDPPLPLPLEPHTRAQPPSLEKFTTFPLTATTPLRGTLTLLNTSAPVSTVLLPLFVL